MITTELPQRLQEEFEQTAHLFYDHDAIRQALTEAVELWLAQRREILSDIEQVANDQIYEKLRLELERDHFGKWIVIAHGQLQGVTDSLEEADLLVPAAQDRIIIQIGEDRPREVELGWQIAFT